MAIKPTPNNSMFKSLVFDGVDSRDYGIYITGDAVFNSPERDVEMIEIPGRNGAYALDKGRFSNIEVSYPAGIAGDTEADFRQGIRAFRNALASRKGYKRLEDEYNPDEYRMAVYKSGLEVTPTALKAGEFTIEFDCMPQRFLKSGETAVSVASGGTITNPTLFESKPLLHVVGHGELTIGDKKVIIYNAELGKTPITALPTNKNYSRSGRQVTIYDTEKLDLSVLEQNDIYWWNGGTYSAPFINAGDFYVTSGSGGYRATITTQGTYFDISVSPRISAAIWSTQVYYVMITPKEEALTFFKEVSRTITDAATMTVSYTTENGATYSRTVTAELSCTVIGINKLSMTLTIANSDDDASNFNGKQFYFVESPTFSGDSTLVPGELYIDAEIGEAYFDTGGSIISANNYVFFEGEIPELPPGETSITYDVDSVTIVPRWWEV